ncbi:hypothetical protein Jiend_30080 [Micromonospora endophytica]|uniref:hypothetical protein n=1 Tax=Micromonospora endophytica TaxID=515350 RepID=UPI001C32D29F|nr:hypothetical protein [Micromonospora endophytica]BCJ59586.1 hypothetical protein Jiend_30080 [Micromonospora endophytica]
MSEVAGMQRQSVRAGEHVSAVVAHHARAEASGPTLLLPFALLPQHLDGVLVERDLATAGRRLRWAFVYVVAGRCALPDHRQLALV